MRLPLLDCRILNNQTTAAAATIKLAGAGPRQVSRLIAAERGASFLSKGNWLMIKNYISTLREKLQVSIWPIPMVLCVYGFILAFLLLWVERNVPALDSALHFVSMSVTSARQVLAAIATSVLSIGGVVFSMTMVALTLTSGQYGPKVLRQFLSDRLSKISLGLFLGTSIYCLVTLSGYGDTDQPNITVMVALLLTILALAGFIGFIHNTATDLQADQIIQRIGGDLQRLLDQLVEEENLVGRNDDLLAWRRAARGIRPVVVAARSNGYLQTIDYSSLVAWSVEHDCRLQVRVRGGDFLLAGTTLVKIYGSDAQALAGKLDSLHHCFMTGPMRTPVQDPEYPITQLNQVAARALSPGINDPGTAITCVDWFSMALGQIADRDLPGKVFLDGEQGSRVLARYTDFDGILKAFYAPARQFSRGNIPVLIALVDSLYRLAQLTTRQPRLAAIAREGGLVYEEVERGDHLPDDLRDFRQRYRKLMTVTGRLEQPGPVPGND